MSSANPAHGPNMPVAGPNDWGPRTFEVIAAGQHYRLSLPALDIVLDVDHVRRERGELHGYLTAYCGLPGARTIVNKVLLAGTTNLGSMTTRKRIGDMLQDRALAKDVDFHGLIEELALRAEEAEKIGDPAINLADVTPAPIENDVWDVKGIRLARWHSTLVHGLADTLKSQIVLMVLAELERCGIPTMFVDWEMDADTHARRLRQLCGADVPPITYVRAARGLVHEIDRLQRIKHEKKIEYVGLDSVGFGCDGPPEAAEHALAFNRAVRQLGIGSIQIAHQAKGENGDKMPFGSAFWFNSARVVYGVKRAEGHGDESRVNVALYPTKSNLFKRGGPVGLEFHFGETQTTVTERDVADQADDLAARLSVPQRMRAILKRGPLTVAALAEELGVPENTITVNVSRGTGGKASKGPAWLTKVSGPNGVHRIALLSTHPEVTSVT
jgi:hypothetical protein